MERGEIEEKKRGSGCGLGLGLGLGLGFEFHILEMPVHILCEIMFKLPAVSIIRCGSVCSSLRNIVTDPSFQQLYLSRAPSSCVVLSDRNRVSCIDCSLHSQTLPSSNHGSSCLAVRRSSSSSTRRRTPPIQCNNKQLVNKTRLVTFQFQFQFEFHVYRRMNLVNSSHGLLCLRDSSYHHGSHCLYYICNPLLGEILRVPPAPTADNQHVRFSAFGFDPRPRKYKILQLVWEKSNRMVAELYRLGDNKWRVIEIDSASSSSSSSSSARPRPNGSFDPSLNGALHWVTEGGPQLICSFDLHTNRFKSVPPPPHFDAGYVNRVSGITVGVLKGRLCLCFVVGGDQFETWFMDRYGVEGSWTKAFSIDIKSYCGLSLQDKHRPIGFSSSGDMWLKADSDSHRHSQSLVSYSPDTGVFRHIDIGGIASNIEATPQVLSYVSLKDMLNLRDPHLRVHTLRPIKTDAFGFNIFFAIRN